MLLLGTKSSLLLVQTRQKASVCSKLLSATKVFSTNSVITHSFANAISESLVTPGRIFPSNGGVAISGTVKKKGIDNDHMIT